MKFMYRNNAPHLDDYYLDTGSRVAHCFANGNGASGATWESAPADAMELDRADVPQPVLMSFIERLLSRD